MSLIMLIKARDGLVLSGDSRMSQKIDNKWVPLMDVVTEKVFVCPNGCGIAQCGNAKFFGEPIERHIKNFIEDKIKRNTLASSIPHLLIDYFNDPERNFEADFLIGGYKFLAKQKNFEEFAYCISFKRGQTPEVERMYPPKSMFACGVPDYVKRYISPAIILPSSYYKGKTEIVEFGQIQKIVNKDSAEQNKIILSPPLFDFSSMFIRDAVDATKILMDLTVKMMRINHLDETVGEPYDILAITPGNTFWVQHKII